jgi:hypothetical protein
MNIPKKTPKDLSAILAPHAREYLKRVQPAILRHMGFIQRSGLNHLLPLIENDMETLLEQARDGASGALHRIPNPRNRCGSGLVIIVHVIES